MPILSPDRAHLDTTTTPAADSLSPRRRSGERVRERGFKRAREFDGTSPSPPALSPLVPRREREQETSAMVSVSRCARPDPALTFLLTLRFSFAPPGLIHADAARRLTPRAIFFRLSAATLRRTPPNFRKALRP